MTTEIFYKSFPPDYPWLAYSLRSLQKFTRGFSKVIVCATKDAQPPPTGSAETVHFVKDREPGYLHQQVIKVHADCFCPGEFIGHLDSDTIFTRYATPEDFIVDLRRPRIWYTKYEDLAPQDRVWQKPTSLVLGRPVEFEFMRRFPIFFPRWAYHAFRCFVWRQHGVSVEEYIHSQPGHEFSEFNALGAYLFYHHHDQIEWADTVAAQEPVYVDQRRSWDGLTPEIRAAWEAILA